MDFIKPFMLNFYLIWLFEWLSLIFQLLCVGTAISSSQLICNAATEGTLLFWTAALQTTPLVTPSLYAHPFHVEGLFVHLDNISASAFIFPSSPQSGNTANGLRPREQTHPILHRAFAIPPPGHAQEGGLNRHPDSILLVSRKHWVSCPLLSVSSRTYLGWAQQRIITLVDCLLRTWENVYRFALCNFFSEPRDRS